MTHNDDTQTANNDDNDTQNDDNDYNDNDNDDDDDDDNDDNDNEDTDNDDDTQNDNNDDDDKVDFLHLDPGLELGPELDVVGVLVALDPRVIGQLGYVVGDPLQFVLVVLGIFGNIAS